MGKLTCTVMLGFLMLHLAVIFLILATGTPEWLVAHHNTTSTNGTKDNTTHPDISKGLWKLCHSDNCSSVNQTLQEEWFRSVQGLAVVGVGLAVIGLILTYMIVLMDRCSKSGPMYVANTATQLLSAVCSLTALAIFGARGLRDILTEEFPDNYEVKFAWSFYVDVAGVVCMSMAALLSVHGMLFAAKSREGYENI